MTRRTLTLTLSLGLLLAAFTTAEAQSLRGSAASLDRQNRQAQAHNFSFLDSPAEVERFVQNGLLVQVETTADYELLPSVSFPYARPEVKAFLDRIGPQYRTACGEKLIVTSLVRPRSHQPRNASSRSVHPTGMAVDLRRSESLTCQSWLEQVLLRLDGQGVIEAVYERRPPHYHVAIFPRPFMRYASERGAASDFGEGRVYRVRQGDSLWAIAQRHGTTVDELQRANGLRSSRVLVGQVLRIPEDE